MVRLKKFYFETAVPQLMQKMSITNLLAVPRLVKVVLNMGVGEAVKSSDILLSAKRDLALIAGQEPIMRSAKKSVAGFKLREGQNIGCMVTIRGDRMYEFIDKLINIALPRVRDFRGLSTKSFDGHGNYSLGIKEQIVFPELSQANFDTIRGLDVTIVTTNSTTNEGCYNLLSCFNFPFIENEVKYGF